MNNGIEQFSQNLPTESGWFWHWDGNQGNAPFPFDIGYSGSIGKCFITMGNHGINEAIW